ncbi:MAG: peptide chain release factor 2 [Candidatus Dojkabacteria bacterium]
MTLSEITEKLANLSERFSSLEKKKDSAKLKAELNDLEKQIQSEDFWVNQEHAQKVSQRAGDIRNEIETLEKLKAELKSTNDLLDDNISESDVEIIQMIAEEIMALEKKVNSIELSTFLSGKFDKNNCILTIKAGQGGTEAMDWSEILMRMYIRYANSVGWKASVVDEVRGQEAGYQTVSLKIEGRFAFGYLKHEHGTHRLVRNSPFNSAGLRQTSFAGVEVSPIVEDDIDIEIRDDDIEFSAVRSSGAGGQNVNKVATKVRIRHIPSGITVESSMHRTQHQNKNEAIRMLKAQLYLIEEQKREAEVSKVKGEYKKASWGNQIRNYVLSPYKLVKDLRTGVETSQADSVLDGNIQEFIDAEVRML